jgi:hypothetical protein
VLGDGTQHGLGVRAGEDHQGRARDPAGVHGAAAEVAEGELAEQAVLRPDAERARPCPHRRGGSGGVEDLGQRRRCAVDDERLRRLGVRERGQVRSALGVRQRQYRRLSRGGSPRPRHRLGPESDDEAGLGVAHHEPVLALGERSQHGDEGAARPGDRDYRLHVRNAVLLDHGHPLSPTQPEAHERSRQARRSLVEVAVAAPALPVDEGDALRPALRGPRRIVGVGMHHRPGFSRSAGRWRSSGPA